MAMTKKDYIAIARIVQQFPSLAIPPRFLDQLAAYFAADNPRFDELQFLEACQTKGKK